MKLSELKVGQSGKVESIQGDSHLVQRFFEMGLIYGAEVRVMRFAPLGDPMSIRIQGGQLALRKSDAAQINISLP